MNVTLTELFATIGRYLLTIEVSDVLDIAIMAFALYKVLTLVQTTKAASLLKGLFVFLAALLLSYLFGLNGIYYLLSRMVEVGVLALIILFQPEIRRILEEMGSRRILALFTRTENASVLEQTIEQTVLACSEMSQSRTGALIVFEREILLDDMLPLSKNVNLSRDLGMRHRAGIGMSENSDAVVVIVSEETGSISVATGGMLKRHLKPETLDNLLRNELLPQEEAGTEKQKFSLTVLLRSRKDGGA